MKRKTRIHKKSLNSLLIAFLVATSIFSFSSIEAYSAEGDLPTISISSPTSGALVNKAVVSGTYENKDETVPYTDLLFSAYENEANPPISDSSSNPKDWIITNVGTNGTWTFTSESLPEGAHKLTVKVSKKTDPDKTVLDSKSISFTIDTTRPFILSSGIVILGNPESFREGEDFTRVPTNAKINVTVSAKNPMTTLKDIVDPIIVYLGSEKVTGTASVESKGVQSGKYIYDIIFTPDTSLTLKSTYTVHINSKIVDDAGNAIYTRFFKFTTMSNTDLSIKDNPNNPHGNFSNTTNLCANCHSTHNGMNDALEKNNYQYSDGGSNHELPAATDSSKSYCLACHDGTMNAPIVNGIEKTYQHNNPANYSKDGHNALKQTDSCTSCHDPHQSWTEENPNMLKGHDIYKSKDKDESKTIDSLDVTCGACHDDNATIKINDYEQPIHKDLLYKKSVTATGDLNDYSLCLRCHKTDNKINIKKYYDNTNSGHYFKMEAGKDTNLDGSKLNGPIPCAECHETHGSDNINMLRDELGNVKLSDADKFKTQGTTWNEANERQFCLKCHNNSTQIYGKNGTLNETISGHQQNDTRGCSTCHGGSTNSFIEAAHAPTKKTP